MLNIRTDRGLTEAISCGIESRSPQWPKIQKEHLKLEPNCACCKPGTNTNVSLQVHHKFPFHYCVALGRPDLELDHRNLITLCETSKKGPCDDHHLLIGHLGSFQSSNLSVDQGVKSFNGMTEDEIKADQLWRQDVKNRLRPLSEMTEDEKRNFKDLMDKTFPLVDNALNEKQ